MKRSSVLVVLLGAAMLLASACVSAAWSPVTAPGSYDFGTLDAGAGATKTVTFTLSNTDKRATAAMTAALNGSPAFTITADSCSGRSLPPRKTCQVRVLFAPTGDGESDSATLAATGPQIDTTIALTGKSGAPSLAWSPTTYDFGTVDAAATPSTQQFTLTNSGDGSSAALTAGLTGSDAMALSDDTCTSATLAPGGTCSVTVTYAPTASGQDDSATLTAGGADATITGESGTPSLAWSPNNYDFGTVDAAATPSTQQFTLTNSGDGSSAALTSGLTGSDAMTLSDDSCTSATLAPGGTCSVTVTYAPTASGQDDSATLSAGGADVTITGKSGTPSLAWSPNNYDFGTVTAGDTPTQQFTLTNSGDGSSDTLTAGLTGSAAMTLSGDTCTGAVLAPGGACTVTVEYAPTGTSTDSATLAAGGADATITGTGQVAPLQITGIGLNDDPDQALVTDGRTVNIIDGSQDNIFTAELANIPAGGVTYQWTITTPNTAGYVVEPDQTESSLLVREDGIPDFNTETSVLTLTVTPVGGGSPVTKSARILYRNSALTLQMDATCHTGGPKVTPHASDTSIPLDGSLTITQTVTNHLGVGCDIGLPFEGAVTISSDGKVIDTFSGGPDVGDGTSPAPVGPFVIPGSTLGLGDHTVTVSYAIWNGPAWAPFSFDFPVTVTDPQPQTISFTSTAPSSATLAGATYTPTATATSGLPVAFSIDAASSSVCAISATTGAVNFTGLGTCTLDANQAGDDDWLAAQQVTQSITVNIFPLIVVINPVDDPQSPPLPPNPAINNCDPPNVLGGGCFLNPLDGSSENIFDATGTIAPATDTGFDSSLYTIDFHWQFFKPPGLGSAPYSASGITGYHASVLDIQPNSMPELLGTDAGQDFYWRVELTVTVNGVTETGWFKFQYQSSTLSLRLSTTCQVNANVNTPLCQGAAANGLPATEPT